MLKIFLTGDNHIGLKYASHEKASILAQKRMEAFGGMVKTANEEHCNLFIITGDLFESTRGVAQRDIKELLDHLGEFCGTVAVLPGNHDYYDEEAKFWSYFADVMSTKDNVMLLREYRPYEITVDEQKVVLYPALCTSKHSAPGENNLGWIKNEEIVSDEAYRIGIAHGAVEGQTIDDEGRYFLMTRSELESIPVDVWLLGHTHVPFPQIPDGETITGERIFNAGTHVQTDVACNTEGQCFIIEVSPDKAVRAKKAITGNLRFCRKTILLEAGKMEQILSRELSGIKDDSVVDLILTGAVSAKEYEDRAAVMERILSRFIEGNYRDATLSKLISKELIESEFPETSFSAALLTSLLDEPKEAQLAYELLQSLKGGK